MMTVFAMDPTAFGLRAAMVETILIHIKRDVIVHVEDSDRPHDDRLLYGTWPGDLALHLFDTRGRRLGVFANIDALVAHAEAVTGW